MAQDKERRRRAWKALALRSARCLQTERVEGRPRDTERNRALTFQSPSAPHAYRGSSCSHSRPYHYQDLPPWTLAHAAAFEERTELHLLRHALPERSSVQRPSARQKRVRTVHLTVAFNHLTLTHYPLSILRHHTPCTPPLHNRTLAP
jgi:hypothetical protein